MQFVGKLDKRLLKKRKTYLVLKQLIQKVTSNLWYYLLNTGLLFTLKIMKFFGPFRPIFTNLVAMLFQLA